MTRIFTLPPTLSRSQKIAVFAPSARGVHQFPERLQRGVQALQNTFGCAVEVPTDIEDANSRLAGPAQERASLFMRLMTDPSVGAIFTTYGGFNTNEILTLIDWDIVRQNPKIVVGYSDTTALLLAIAAKTGMTTYYGPAVLPQLGEVAEPFGYTLSDLFGTLVTGAPRDIEMLDYWYDQTPDWATNDHARERLYDGGAYCALPGRAEGILFGGNVSTINYLVGTQFLKLPDAPTILFLEMVDSEADWFRFRRSLTHLRDSGCMENVTGIIVGKSPQTGTCQDLHGIFTDILPEMTGPIILNAPFGHFDPITTLPIGVKAAISSTPEQCAITLVERTVGGAE